MRLFIGILLPRAVQDSVAESARLLEQHCAAGRFVPRENYHLTLAFLGEQPEGALETIWKDVYKRQQLRSCRVNLPFISVVPPPAAHISSRRYIGTGHPLSLIHI